MASNVFQALPGFRDFTPRECAVRNYLFETWRGVARRCGYVEYETPILEDTGLYLKKSGGELSSQLFRFEDQGGRDVTLRPEVTASLARIAAAEQRQYPKPLKWFEIGQCFRYEKPQKGRGREFYQFNVDILGEPGTGADAELIALAKAKPGEINYASTGNGTLPHLAAEFFKQQAKVNMVHIAYKGSAPATTDLLGGNVQVFFGNMLSVIEQVRAGRLRALAVTSLQRQAVAQDIPTMIESGFPGFEAGTWFGLLVPAGTPREVVGRLHADTAKAVRQPDVQKQLAGQGATTIGNTPEQFAAYIKSESAKWAKVLAASGVKAD